MKNRTFKDYIRGGYEFVEQSEHESSVTDVSRYFPGKPEMRQATYVEIPAGEVLLDRFTVCGCIGDDAVGRLYLLEDAALGEKVTARIYAGIEEHVPDWFVGVNRLKHRIRDYRHVICPLEFHRGRWGGGNLSILSMEFLDGGTLSDWSREPHRESPNRLWEALRFVRQACYGLGTLEDAGITHRAIIPEHLLIASENLKVGGLEYCVDLQNADANRLRRMPENFATYLAPERFASPQQCDVRGSVYSLGVILFQVAHPEFQPPFQGSPKRLAVLHNEAPPPPLPGVPDEIQTILLRCLEKDPKRRFGDHWSVLCALETCSASHDNVPEIGDNASRPNSVVPGVEAWKQALDHYEQNDLRKAASLCRETLTEFPDHAGARGLLDKIENRAAEAARIYSVICSGEARGSLEEQANLLAHAEAVYPNHYSRSAGHEAFVRRCERFRDAARDTEEAMQHGQRNLALNLLEHAASLSPGSTIIADLQLRIREDLARKRNRHDQMHDAFIRGDARTALRMAACLDGLARRRRGDQP
ncbi:MAG: protein kinase [Candidatus Hydrogenedentes bacterium]|nr:protein kinase [Candidatus Hydrogenedentota bacterium]